MPDLPKNARHGTSEASELVRPLRDLHLYVSQLPVVELLSFSGVVAFPLKLITTVENPRAMQVNVRTFPDDGTDVGAALPTWRFDAERSEIVITGIDGVPAATGYTIDALVFGERK